MISRSAEVPVVAFSVRVYQTLLAAYPTRFQQEYGPHMVQVFHDCCLRAVRQGGRSGMAQLWVMTLLDLFRSLIEEHTRKETDMTRSKFIRLSGWSLMLTAAIFLSFFLLAYLDENNSLSSSLQPLYSFGYFAVVLGSPVLLTVGLLGLRSRYGETVGAFGKQVLLFGVEAGVPVSLIGIIGEAVFSWDWAWFAQFAGPGVLLACLALFGIPTLSRHPLLRWNALPLLAGSGYALLILYSLAVSALTGEPLTSEGIAFYTMIVSVQCAALFMLGYILKSDVPEEVATA